MAVNATPDLQSRVEWLEAPGVTADELRQTWARFELWTDDRCLTQVTSPDGSLRRSITASLYPLAEWIAEHWWSLSFEVRPSAVPVGAWSWSFRDAHPWLRRHNLRAAGEGMPWPNLTVVPEGSITRLRWFRDESPQRGPVHFVSEGEALVPHVAAVAGLRGIVELVLERLEEQGVFGTHLAREWAAIAAADSDEGEFCQAAARLGLDPYSVPQSVTSSLLELAGVLPADLLDGLYDAADWAALPQAAAWVKKASAGASRLATKPTRALREVLGKRATLDQVEQPWLSGYEAAVRLRRRLDVAPPLPFDPRPWVSSTASADVPGQVQGLAAVSAEHGCGLVHRKMPKRALGFAQARTLGLAATARDDVLQLLTPVRTDREKFARAFAAELLAPAEGIAMYLEALGSPDDAAFEAVADRYGVSPLLVSHQYDNQILR